MNVLIIIALFCIVGFALRCRKKPVLKGAPARTWPASRGKLAAKPKPTAPS